jgi:hypothetical protein
MNMINLLRRAWDTLDTFKQAYPENWHEEDEQVLEDLMQADLNLSGGEFDRFIPPQREWQGLTDEERQECLYSDPIFGMALNTFASAIEAKLKEKNGL